MRAYVLNSYCHDGRTDIIHYYFFHGVASRQGLGPDDCIAHRLAGRLDTPIQIMRNFWTAPDIILPHPGIGLVVSERLRDTLSDIRNIKFAQVEFINCVKYPYAVGDFLDREDIFTQFSTARHRPSKLFDVFRRRHGIQGALPAYYEVVTEVLQLIAPQYEDTKQYTYFVNTPLDCDSEDLPLSPSLLTDYPVTCAGPMVIAESVFDRLNEYIEKDYFSIVPLDVT